MRFHKVGKHALRCIVSAQEMWESGMQVDDFLKDRDKTEEFIRDVVERARTEVGFECTGEAFSVQISLMADSSVILMISNEEPNIMQFLNALRSHMGGAALPAPEEGTCPGCGADMSDADATPVIPVAETTVSTKTCVIALATMDEVIEAAERLLGNFDIESSLYKLGDTYYMIFEIWQEGLKCENMQPYVAEYYLGDSSDEAVIAHIKEFGTCLIKEEAVEVLAAL